MISTEKQRSKKEKKKRNNNSTKHTESKSDREQSSEKSVDPEYAKIALDAKDEQIEELENENKMLRVLATTGIVTNTYIHEFKTLSHRLSMKIRMAKDAIEKDQDMEEACNYINQANQIREVLIPGFK